MICNLDQAYSSDFYGLQGMHFLKSRVSNRGFYSLEVVLHRVLASVFICVIKDDTRGAAACFLQSGAE